MKLTTLLAIGCIATITSTTSIAATTRCMSYNSYHQHWFRTRLTWINAVYAARAACKANSADPLSCVVPANSCIHINPVPPAPVAVCSVHDRHRRHWTATGPNACSNALAQCRHWHQINYGPHYAPYGGWACMY